MENMHYDEQELRVLDNSGQLRTDAGETVFFARQLEYVRSTTYDVERPALSAWDLFPIDYSIPAGANTITWRQWDKVGQAKVIASYADDLPKADVTALETTTAIRGIGISYGYDRQEIRNAQYAGISLDTKRAQAAREGHEQTINRLAWAGDTISGLPGFLTAPLPVYVFTADGTGSSKLWSTKTPLQKVRDMNGIANSVFIQSNGVKRADELWLPLTQYTDVASAKLDTGSDTTVLDYFLMTNPFVKKVIPVFELGGAGAGGTDVAVALQNSAMNYQMNIPLVFTQLPAQPRNLYFEVPCESRFGGVTVERPGAFAIGTGI